METDRQGRTLEHNERDREREIKRERERERERERGGGTQTWHQKITDRQTDQTD